MLTQIPPDSLKVLTGWSGPRCCRISVSGTPVPALLSDQMATITRSSASLASGVIEHLAGTLATADKKLKECEAECARIKSKIVSEMIDSGIKSERTCWGLVSLQSRDKVTYSDAIACLEIDLKAAKSKEVKMGIAKVTEGDKFIRVTWSK